MQCSKTTEQYNNKRIVVVLSLIGSEERTSGQWSRSVGVGIVIHRDAAPDLSLASPSRHAARGNWLIYSWSNVITRAVPSQPQSSAGWRPPATLMLNKCWQWAVVPACCELGELQTLYENKRLSFSFARAKMHRRQSCQWCQSVLPVLLVMPSVEINVCCVNLRCSECRVWEGAIVLTWLPSRDTRAACLQMCQSREKYRVTYELWMQVQNIEYEAMMIYDVMPH